MMRHLSRVPCGEGKVCGRGVGGRGEMCVGGVEEGEDVGRGKVCGKGGEGWWERGKVCGGGGRWVVRGYPHHPLLIMHMVA